MNKRIIALLIISIIVACSAEWWIMVSLSAVVLYGSLITLDALMVKSSLYKSYDQAFVITALLQLLPWMFFPFPDASLGSSLHGDILALCTGVVHMIGFVCYFKAMFRDQDAVTVSILWNLMIAVIPITAYLSIGEVLTEIQYYGITLIFLGAIVASLKKAHTDGSVIVFMLGAVLCLSIASVGMKEVYNIYARELGDTNFWGGLLMHALGCGIVGLLFLGRIGVSSMRRTSFKQLVSTYWPLFLCTEVIQVSADGLVSLAMTAGDVSVIAAMDGLTGIAIIGLSLLVARFKDFFPKDVRAAAISFTEEQLAQPGYKIAGMALVVVGAALAT